MGSISGGAATEVFDRRGDLKLVVGEDNSERGTFQVCSRTLARSSPVWDTMFYGPFREGFPQQNSDEWTVSLPEDDPDGLRVILSALHGKFDAVPEGGSLDFIVNLAALADKYDTVASLRPFWKVWLGSMYYPSESSERSPRHMPGHRLVQHLWLYYTLGCGREFQSFFRTLVHRTSLDSGGRPQITAADLLQGLRLDDCYLDSNKYLGFILNAHKIDEIKQRRLTLLSTMWIKLQNFMRYLPGPICKAQQGAVACDSAFRDAVRGAMESVGVKHWYCTGGQNFPEIPPLSAIQLYDILDEIRRRADSVLERRVRHPRSAHAKCVIRPHLALVQSNGLPEDEALAWGYQRRLDKRAEKSGLGSAADCTVGY